MPIEDILDFIDQEISQLQRARTLLADDSVVEMPEKRRGRPKGSTNKPHPLSAPFAKQAGKRTMSPEGKARIAAAQKARWAKQKKTVATAKKTANASSSVLAKKTVRPAGKKALTKKASVARKKVTPTKWASDAQAVSSSADTGKV